ncbi:MAG: hypothetical protein EOP24_27920 [Hyphomicrobiales bacterium]|nr:MAG: hypothetical protein EOP24_27920 [Hyphomicrobiales bacterium]
MASGQQLADEYVQRFATWKNSKSNEEFRNLVVRGVLSRKDIVAECGFSGSVLNQNPRVKKALQDLEEELRERQILPSKASASARDSPEPETTLALRESSVRAAQDAERLSRLEQENASLRAENGELKRLLSRYAVLQEALAETGRLPR